MEGATPSIQPEYFYGTNPEAGNFSENNSEKGWKTGKKVFTGFLETTAKNLNFYKQKQAIRSIRNY